MFVERPPFSKGDDLICGHVDDVEITCHVHISDVTLEHVTVRFTGREIDAHKILEDERLGRLGERGVLPEKSVRCRVEDVSEFLPLHLAPSLRSAMPNPSRPTSLPK